jgi:hypothetical protein
MRLPDIFPRMPAMQIAMARMAKAQVVFLKKSASFIPGMPSAVVRGAGTVIITLSLKNRSKNPVIE